MTIFDFDNFYYKHIDMENYQEIIEEIRFYLIPLLDTSISGVGIIKIPENDLINNCTKLSDWLKQNDMFIEMAALHIMPKKHTGYIHSDHDGSGKTNLAFNLDIENGDTTTTKFFEVSVPGKIVHTSGQGLPYVVYPYSKDTCKKVTEYNLTKPVLLNISKPHLVTNDTDHRRVALTLRFKNDPVHLLW